MHVRLVPAEGEGCILVVVILIVGIMEYPDEGRYDNLFERLLTYPARSASAILVSISTRSGISGAP